MPKKGKKDKKADKKEGDPLDGGLPPGNSVYWRSPAFRSDLKAFVGSSSQVSTGEAGASGAAAAAETSPTQQSFESF
eukprot:COSAG05_NODE_8353_length_711_cov_1.598039_1_plen_76_part_10